MVLMVLQAIKTVKLIGCFPDANCTLWCEHVYCNLHHRLYFKLGIIISGIIMSCTHPLIPHYDASTCHIINYIFTRSQPMLHYVQPGLSPTVHYVEIRLVRRWACAHVIHVISYIVFKYLICIKIITIGLVANVLLSFRCLSQHIIVCPLILASLESTCRALACL